MTFPTVANPLTSDSFVIKATGKVQPKVQPNPNDTSRDVWIYRRQSDVDKSDLWTTIGIVTNKPSKYSAKLCFWLLFLLKKLSEYAYCTPFAYGRRVVVSLYRLECNALFVESKYYKTHRERNIQIIFVSEVVLWLVPLKTLRRGFSTSTEKFFFSIFVICLSAFAVLNATTCSTLHCGEREKLEHFLARNVVFATIPRFFLFECRWRKDETRSKRCKRKENSNRESKFMLITLSRTCLILIYIISEFSCETLISFNVNNRQGAQHIYMRIVLQIIQNYGNSYFKCL